MEIQIADAYKQADKSLFQKICICWQTSSADEWKADSHTLF